MMNRGVMQRQMFRNGGEASFPDLSGDGRISQKDVLMGRGVQGLAMGGPPMDPNMMPPPPPMDPNMMPPPPMAPPPMPPAGAEQALMGAEAQGQQAGMMAMEGMMQDIDGAQDYESLINGLRGNDMPLDARYAELAGLVGPEDAQQTPESVLTLTQPAIMMTEEGALNSGVGELMRGIAGDVEMEGPMSEGVGGLMMAQAPEPAMNDPMMEAGNTPPVNFRQGGPVEVRGYQAGDEAKVGGGQPLNPVIAQANRDASAYQDYFAGAMDSEARAADLEEQRKMSQAQMLFDIAQTGLQFAGNTQGSSIAERLANAAAQTQLPQRIGERAAGMLSAKQAQRAEDRQMRMAGLQASLQQSVADKTAADALALAQTKVKEESIKDIPMSIWKNLPKETQDSILLGKESTVNGVPMSIYNNLPEDQQKIILKVETIVEAPVKGIPAVIFNALSADVKTRVLVGEAKGVNGVPRDIYDALPSEAKDLVVGAIKGPVKGIPFAIFDTFSDAVKEEIVLGRKEGVNGIPRDIYDGLDPAIQKLVIGAVEGDVKGVPRTVFDTLTQKQQERLLLGDPQGVNGIPIDIYNTLSEKEQKVVLNVAESIKGIPKVAFDTLTQEEQRRVMLGDPQGVNGIPRDIYDGLPETTKKIVLGAAAKPASSVKGIPVEVFNELTDEDKRKVLLGDPQGVNGIPRDIFDDLGVSAQEKVLGVADGPVKGVPRDVYNTLTDDQKSRLMLGDPQGVNGIPRDIYDELPEATKALIVDPGAAAKLDQKLALERISKEIEGRADLQGKRLTAQEKQATTLAAYNKERDEADRKIREATENRLKAAQTFNQTMDQARFDNEKDATEYSKLRDKVLDDNTKIDQLLAERDMAVKEGNFELAKEKAADAKAVQTSLEADRDRMYDLAVNKGNLAVDQQADLQQHRTDLLLQDTLKLSASVEHNNRMALISEAKLKLLQDKPDIRVMGDTVYDFSSGEGIEVKGPDGESINTRKTTTTNINGTIIDTTDPTNAKIVYQDPRTKYEIVEGQFVDMSSGKPVPVMTIPKQGVFKEYDNKLYELIPGKEPREILKTGIPAPDFYDILMPDGSVAPADANTVNGRAVVDLAIAEGRKITRIGTTKTYSGQGFLSDVGVITSYDGRTFLDPKTGDQRLLTDVGAVRVSDQMIGQYKKVQGRSESALASLAKMDQVLIDNLLVDGSNVITDMSPEARAEFVKLNGLEGLNDAQIALKIKNGVRDAYQQARKGTGFWSNIAAGLDVILGGPLGSPELSGRLFGDITDARQFSSLTEILGRSALRLQVARPAYAETKELGTLFPNPNKLLSSPKTEANKLVSLGQQLRLEKRALLEIIANPQGTEKTLITKYQNKVNEIGRLQEMLGPVIGFGENPTQGNNAALSQEAVGPDGLTNKQRILQNAKGG